MGDRYDVPSQRLEASILFTCAAIPHAIWGQDAVHFSLSGAFFFFADLDLQILLPPSRIQQAVELLAPTYSIMSHKEIDDENKAHTDSEEEVYVDYTHAFRDCPDDFARLKLMQRDTKAEPSHVLLISNTIFDYPLHDIVQKRFPLCPELPFPSVPALIRIMPVLMQKRIDMDFSVQNFSFISSCRLLLEAAINSSFPKELKEEFDDGDQLPTRLKEMMSGLDERQRGWIYDLFLIEGEPGGSDSDEGVWDTLFPHCSPLITESDFQDLMAAHL
ncbi:hypothetical protein ARMGADRAFT_1005607 [Armillaria gallica]|uniref:Uncharacterized protein n=1 Tax=Armillaria gallica TaxID=47427 RepID=A0A2H3E7Q8_ARMGA|nr:hypothetical protein ARMGADRAFT_1005607 [Armillaria gallica]